MTTDKEFDDLISQVLAMEPKCEDCGTAGDWLCKPCEQKRKEKSLAAIDKRIADLKNPDSAASKNQDAFAKKWKALGSKLDDEECDGD